ncbi:MAG TPA: hypothetical protein PLS07_07615 [Niabella sp.]|nr:hypothetical protein [Niabella sp.]HQW14948.1 hypothetical protein [Niabella sp.]HQX20160.1 hypothetical protein [Niabella sp.]HQX41916.1 hypothetical protein [Niabella sp.]HRB06765.1 hypothetical protein [Niabella sp.]
MSERQDKPPFFKSWSSWYWIVFGVLVLLMLFFYYLTKKYS